MSSYNKTRIVIRDDTCLITTNNSEYIIKATPYRDMARMHIERYNTNRLSLKSEYGQMESEWDDNIFKIENLTIYIVYWDTGVINWVIDKEVE